MINSGEVSECRTVKVRQGGGQASGVAMGGNGRAALPNLGMGGEGWMKQQRWKQRQRHSMFEYL